MVQPRSTGDDDLLPELPRLEGGVEGEENFQPKDDSDLGLGDETSDLGLDVEAGLDEPIDSELDGIEDEPASWLDDGKENPALADDDGSELDGDDESNLTEGSEPASDQAEDWDEDFGFDDRGGTVGDSGEEGFGDESLIGALDLDALPPLDDSASSEEEPIETDPFAAEAFAELGSLLDDESSEELQPGMRCTRIDAARVKLEVLLRSGRPLARIIALGADAVAWDGSTLLVAEAGARRAQPRPSELDAVLALAAATTPQGAWIAAATPSGLLCSRDLGRSFARVQLARAEGMPELLASLAITRTAAGARLWAAGAAGALWASDDGGQSFRCVRAGARVLGLASNGGAALAALVRAEDGGALALCSPDGDRFDATALPVSEIERVQDLQAAGDVLLCCRRAPLPQLSIARRGAWRDVADALPPAVLLHEGDVLRLYFWVVGVRGTHLLRDAIGSDAPSEIVAELPRDAGAPLQLCGHHQDGTTTLHVGTERTWYRLTVGREGAPR